MSNRYGWIPDIPDVRDRYCRFHPSTILTLPVSVDLRPGCPAVYDQGNLGSCTANGIAGAHQFEQIRQAGHATSFVPSRLFIYWNERALEGTINQDAGALIRDGMKVVAKMGVCPESQWPYRPERFTERAPRACYRSALSHQVLEYRRVPQTLIQIKACLASGHPIVFGWSVYESAETSSAMSSGYRPLPQASERMLGGHCEKIVGYFDDSRCFLIRGSWGTAVGDKGYFRMPYDYLTNSNLAADFWTMSLVEQPTQIEK